MEQSPHAMKWIHGRAGQNATRLKGAALTTGVTASGTTTVGTTGATTNGRNTTSLQHANADNDES